MSVGVFCNVSASEADLLRFTLKPLLGHDGVTSVVILHTGFKRPDCFGELAGLYGKVRELHRSFGEGYHRSVASGGYDQYSARVAAVEEVEKDGVDWIVQFDADEFLTTDAINAILSAENHHDVVLFDYYTLLSEQSYWCEPKLVRNVWRREVFDPHPLVWRRRLEKRPALCKITARIERNVTRHCSVTFQNHPYWRVSLVRGLHHFHFHCLLDKANAGLRRQGRHFTETLPPEVTKCVRDLMQLRCL